MLPDSISLEICKIRGFCLPLRGLPDRDIIVDDSGKLKYKIYML